MMSLSLARRVSSPRSIPTRSASASAYSGRKVLIFRPEWQPMRSARRRGLSRSSRPVRPSVLLLPNSPRSVSCLLVLTSRRWVRPFRTKSRGWQYTMQRSVTRFGRVSGNCSTRSASSSPRSTRCPGLWRARWTWRGAPGCRLGRTPRPRGHQYTSDCICMPPQRTVGHAWRITQRWKGVPSARRRRCRGTRGGSTSRPTIPRTTQRC
mmetsp:Transcript_2429/g.5425  ORF Transcript_2429/g.5425 Transcript_2429/m.5425 type:complete len:208 (+) Transcript_2429:615-1238(+)